MKKWVCTVCGYVYEGDNSSGRMSSLSGTCQTSSKNSPVTRHGLQNTL